ncbi:D-cysteine desulfhydrase [Bacillus sp. FJAT-44742]|uniref:D-cysteine desulfhydrase n=1 Tax=Bacillus sp. FJAT-44742 TaxID=2014005 RepID=UPI000C24A348|nr:D-cysteine desulfhydrase [Bacillus sp. FJAT-44742]
MNINKIARRKYTEHPTAIEYLPHVTKFLGGPNIFVKRDDLLGLTLGGNKTRKLEFLVADALEKGADTLITCGAIQSNHCRLTLAAAVKEGLKCRLVLEERVPNTYDPDASGNNFLFKLLGAENIDVVPVGTDMHKEMMKVSSLLEEEGRKGYVIPGGGSNEIGAMGYVACAQELLNQTFQMGLNIDHIVTASGSGGTHAGLLTGFYGRNANIPITGINVSRGKKEQEELIYNLVKKLSTYLELDQPVTKDIIRCMDNYVGEGYSIPTDTMIEAVNILAQKEGILLDPVYTGKAMAGLIHLIREGFFTEGDNVLFIHTGGSPALYVYMETLLASQSI